MHTSASGVLTHTSICKARLCLGTTCCIREQLCNMLQRSSSCCRHCQCCAGRTASRRCYACSCTGAVTDPAAGATHHSTLTWTLQTACCLAVLLQPGRAMLAASASACPAAWRYSVFNSVVCHTSSASLTVGAHRARPRFAGKCYLIITITSPLMPYHQHHQPCVPVQWKAKRA